MIALRQHPAVTLFGQAWSWWTGELAAMLPSRPRIGGRVQPRVDVHVGGTSTAIERVVDGVGERFVDDRPLDALDDAAWAELADLAAGAPVRLVLAAPDVHATMLELPRQARGRLRQAVALQLGEVAPVDPASLVWTIGSVAAVGEKIAVELVMVKAARIEALADQFAQRGHAAPELVARLADGQLVPLAPARGRRLGGRGRPAWWLALALVGSIPLTSLILTRLVVASNARAIDAVADAAQANAARERALRRSAEIRAGMAPLARELALSPLLDELADRLPGDASLLAAERARSGEVRLTIAAAEPATVRDALATDPLVRFAEQDEAPLDDGRMRVVHVGRRR